MLRLIRFGIKGVLLCTVLAVIAGLWIRSELKTPYYGAASAETFIDIPKGAGSGAATHILASRGIIHSSLPLKLYLRFSRLEHRIQAGEYKFAEPATPIQIARRLVRGDAYFRSITIPEGLTAKETIDLLIKNGLGDRSELEQALLRTEWIRDIDSSAGNLEGFLFPETYRFGRKDNSEAIIKSMIGQFRIILTALQRASAIPSGWNIARIVTLASLIEKEAQKSEERPLIASVLINRINKRMTLGCDASIIYAMKLSDIYNGRLGRNDLRMESPYNTYIHRDLPPGPICNPGIDSIRAAMNPAKTDYLYYVSRNDGTHQFSKDLRAHNLAVYRYQKAPARKKTGSRG